MKIFLPLLFLLVSYITSFGQHTDLPKNYLEKVNSDYFADRNLSVHDFFEILRPELSFSDPTEMQLIRSTGNKVVRHFRFQQYHEDIPVFGHQLILHEQSGVVTHVNGVYTPGINASPVPLLSRKDVENTANIFIYNSEKFENKSHIYIDSVSLVYIDPAYPKFSGKVVLAYSIDVIQHNPYHKERIVIDANTGMIILTFPLIHMNSVTGEARTRYYGTQLIQSDSVGVNKFILRDLSRGDGIYIYNAAGQQFESESRNWDLTNQNGDEVALDAMYCSARFYDYLESVFQWSGLDGKGMSMRCRIHDNGYGSVNAYWDGKYASFGDGNCDYGPLTTLEVVAHEFAHGVVEHTSGLLYFDESGALNESFADMMGKVLEYIEDYDNFSWLLGTSFRINPEAKPFRSLSDPKSLYMPAYYKGEYWIDDADVHINSSIGNLWFVMLSEGRAGISEGGLAYDVKSIGIEKAAKIAFQANRDYCYPGTTYKQFASYTILVAGEIFGQESFEVEAVKEAWKATGVVIPGFEVQRDLAISNVHNQQVVCGYDDFVPIIITVSNQGALPYHPFDGATISLFNTSLEQRFIPLQQLLQPGESIVIEVNDWARYSGNGFETYNFDILSEGDEVQDNNYGYYFIQYRDAVSNDLAVSMYNTGFGGCKGSDTEFTVTMSNHSCTPISKGNVIKLKIWSDPQVILHEEDIILEEDLLVYRTIYKIVDLPVEASGEIAYFCIAELEGDSEPFNNNGISYIYVRNTIDYDFYEDFKSFDFSNSELFVFSPVFLATTTDFDGETWLGFTGSSIDTTGLQHCLAPDQIFNGFSNGVIKACVDFSDSPECSLEFDVIGFRNSYATRNGYPYSLMLKVAWDGSESGDHILYGFKEGEKEHYSFDLPPNFIGTVSFEFFTELGQIFINEKSYEDDDVLLLSNLKFSKNSVSNREKSQKSSLILYPNPTTGICNILIKDNMLYQQYQIYDTFGRMVRTGKMNGTTLDMGSLQPGVYIVQLQSLAGRTESTILVRL